MCFYFVPRKYPFISTIIINTIMYSISISICVSKKLDKTIKNRSRFYRSNNYGWLNILVQYKSHTRYMFRKTEIMYHNLIA